MVSNNLKRCNVYTEIFIRFYAILYVLQRSVKKAMRLIGIAL